MADGAGEERRCPACGKIRLATDFPLAGSRVGKTGWCLWCAGVRGTKRRAPADSDVAASAAAIAWRKPRAVDDDESPWCCSGTGGTHDRACPARRR